MDLGKWLRSRREDVVNTVNNVRQAPNRLLDLLDGPQNKPVEQTKLNFNNLKDSRLNFGSGDVQLNNEQDNQSDVLRGIQFGGQPFDWSRKPVHMPTVFPGGRVEHYEDGTSEYIGKPVDNDIYVHPQYLQELPVPYKDIYRNYRRSI